MAATKETVFNHIKEILIEEFEINENEITPAARLFEDLGVDSIDAVDLIVKLKPYINGTIEPEQFKKVKTVQDVVDVIFPLVK
jgi:acyl carrier protein